MDMSIFIDNLPVIITALVSVISAFLTMLLYMINKKKKLIELEIANVELETAIIKGSYIICPECKAKIYLKDTKVFTDGGISNED